MADKIAELFGDEPTKAAEPTAAAPEAPKVETPTQAATQPSATPQPETQKPAVVEPSKPEPGLVPLAAHLDERHKRQKAEERLAALEAQVRKPEQAPSVQDDPEGFAQYVQQIHERASISSRFDVSETLATEKHGEAVVKAAMEWGMERSQQSPAFAAEYLKQKHPIDWAVKAHKRELRNAEIGDDFDAYLEREATKRGWSKGPAAPQATPQATPAAPQPVAQSPTPRPSLASAPSAGGLQTPVPQPSKALQRLGLD
jgi:hypothetical protein